MRFTYQNGTRPLAGYTIHHGIHRGGFGEVYYAHSDGGKEVALKLLHDEDRETELRGVAHCLNLKHPNLINIFDVKADEHGDQWVIMEYVSGSNLEDVLAAFPDGLPLTEVRQWLSGMVAGVAHLHDRGIIHRDMKPANTYCENGVVKVGDVGLSKQLDSENRRRHTQSVGTVYYMAPEVAQGKYGPEVDVYSLGVMLYEMITGKLPFTGETTAEILMKHLTAQPNLMPIPAAIRPVIAHALEKDPRKRTPSVKQLELEFLRAIQSPEAVATGNASDTNGHVDTTQPGQPPADWLNFQADQRRVNGTRTWSSSVSERDLPLIDQIFRKPVRAYFFAVLVGMAFSAFFLFVIRTTATGRVPWGIFLMLGMPVLAPLAFYEFHRRQRWREASRKSRESFQRYPESLRKGPFRRWTNFEGIEPQPEVAEDRKPNAMPRSYPSFNVNQASAGAPPLRTNDPRSAIRTTLSGKISVAGLIAALLSIGIYLILITQFRTVIMSLPEHAVLFAAVSILGSWLLIVAQTMSQFAPTSKRKRWLTRVGCGALLGTCAFGLQKFLAVHIPATAAFRLKSAFYEIGANPLTEAGVDPTWLGYAVFFAVWMGFCRLSREQEENRVDRLSLGVTAKSVFMAFLASILFTFPQWYALLWAGAISVTLQLASPWTPPAPSKQRR